MDVPERFRFHFSIYKNDYPDEERGESPVEINTSCCGCCSNERSITYVTSEMFDELIAKAEEAITILKYLKGN